MAAAHAGSTLDLDSFVSDSLVRFADFLLIW
jgi:hypothetical protein